MHHSLFSVSVRIERSRPRNCQRLLTVHWWSMGEFDRQASCTKGALHGSNGIVALVTVREIDDAWFHSRPWHV